MKTYSIQNAIDDLKAIARGECPQSGAAVETPEQFKAETNAVKLKLEEMLSNLKTEIQCEECFFRGCEVCLREHNEVEHEGLEISND